MSSLSKQLDALRPPGPHCLETEFQSVSTITFCPWQATEWTLSWSRLDALSFACEEELERLDLFFPHHRVIIVGENLRKSLEDFRTFRVRKVRDLPSYNRVSLDPNESFVTQLEVRLLADPKSHAMES